MPARRRAPDQPAPTVTITDPTGLLPPSLPANVAAPRKPWSRRTKAVVAVLVLLVLIGVVVRADRARDLATEPAQLRLTFVEAHARQGAVGTPRSALQDALVDVVVRNDSRFRVRLLSAQLDGGGPVVPGPSSALAPGKTGSVTVRWRVRCAEIGQLPGPRALGLRVRGRTGVVRALRLPFPRYGEQRAPAKTFHTAAVQACAVLVTRTRV